jgi:hypothetical protein
VRWLSGPSRSKATTTDAGSAADADEPVDLRELYRTQLMSSIGGWQGMLLAGLPTVVFVVVNATTTLRAAIIAAVSTGVVLTVYRLVRKQSVQQSLSGLLGVVVAAVIAARTGQARGYFLLGIWQSFVYAVPFVVSMLVRRPLVGLVWEFVDPVPVADDGPPDPPPWHRRQVLFRAYLVATALGAALFLARGFVQLSLYGQNATGWLAFARIAMGYPLFALAAAAGWWVVRRARASITPVDGTAPLDAGAAPRRAGSADDGGAERGLDFG